MSSVVPRFWLISTLSKNPSAVANLRAPIYEEKVVDFLLELAKVTEKTVSREELYNEDDQPAAA